MKKIVIFAMDKIGIVWYNVYSKREEGIAHDEVPYG